MKAVILAGGAGTRLRPLTYVMPKCLLPVGGKPLLERTMTYLSSHGIREFVVCVGYLQKQVMDSMGDGSSLGFKIEYAKADSPMGTGGQLKTAEGFVHDTFVGMNGDIVTDLDIGKLVDAHRQSGATATLALKKFEVKVPYGHIETADDASIRKFSEKPTFTFSANAGVYVMEPKIFSYIPPGRQCSLERETFPDMLSKGEKMSSYYQEAKWADVGSMTDFERVNDEALAMQVGSG